MQRVGLGLEFREPNSILLSAKRNWEKTHLKLINNLAEGDKHDVALSRDAQRARITKFLGMASSRASQQQLTARYHFELVFDKLEY